MAIIQGWLILTFVLLAPPPAVDRPEEIIRSAITAAGGETLLNSLPAARVTGKGTMFLGTNEAAFTCEQAYQLPGRYRTHVQCQEKGLQWEMLQVVNDGVARQQINGKVTPLLDAAARELQTATLLNEIAQLTPLLADRKFVVKHDKQAKATDQVGLLVQVKGYPEIRVGFDRKSGHIVRLAYKESNPENAKDMEIEISLDDFKTVSGLTRSTHSVVMRDGKKVLELQIEKFTPLEKIDVGAFSLKE